MGEQVEQGMSERTLPAPAGLSDGVNLSLQRAVASRARLLGKRKTLEITQKPVSDTEGAAPKNKGDQVEEWLCHPLRETPPSHSSPAEDLDWTHSFGREDHQGKPGSGFLILMA